MERSVRLSFVCVTGLACLLCGSIARARGAPPLPKQDGDVLVAAQEWPRQPGPRDVRVYVRYPGGMLDNVQPTTGLMLSLHNWGGTDFRGTADPAILTSEYDVVVIGVDYLQSGPYDAVKDMPYDFGWLQALDALRALYYVWSGLDAAEKPFDRSRVFATGGSGGGNVTLMANKLAPRTFACVVELSGMAKLADDLAFGIPGRTSLNAGYSREAGSDRFLSADEQAIRFIGHPEHARVMKQLGNTARIVIVHGEDDKSCPVEDAREMAQHLKAAGLDVDTHFVGAGEADGEVFKNSEHSLGDRTRIVRHCVDRFLDPKSPEAVRRPGKSDFDCRDEAVRYKTEHGTYIISYEAGYPVGRFEPDAPAAASK